MATFGDGMIAFAIAFAFVGFFWCLTSIDNSQTDYEVCINKCPETRSYNFANLECPKMCEGILNKDANCTTDESGDKS